MSKIENGRTYKDKVTGFQGVCVGYVSYISGCNQALLLPKAKLDGGYVEGHWIDEQRLEAVDRARIVLENVTATGVPRLGCDVKPPVR